MYGAFYLHHDPGLLLGCLLDDLTPERVEVDMVDFSGQAFRGVDNRLMSLQLVHRGLTGSERCSPLDGDVVQPADVFYKKNVLVERGSFRPITMATLDMLECAQRTLFDESGGARGRDRGRLRDEFPAGPNPQRRDRRQGFPGSGRYAPRSGKDRLDFPLRPILQARHLPLRSHTEEDRDGPRRPQPSIEIFEEKYYDDLGGGILESLGRLFKNHLKLFIYPLKDPETGKLVNAKNLQVAPHLRHLYAHLIENGCIEDLPGFTEDYLPIFPAEVLEKIQSGDRSWKKLVPPEVAAMIEKRRMFNCAP